MIHDLNKELSEVCLNRFGKIAIDMGFVTIEQVLGALIEQAMDNVFKNRHTFIGEILLRKSMMTNEQVEIVLNRLSKDMAGKKE